MGSAQTKNYNSADIIVGTSPHPRFARSFMILDPIQLQRKKCMLPKGQNAGNDQLDEG